MAEAQTTNQAQTSAKDQAIAAGERVEKKAKELVDVVVDSTMKWAGLGLGASRKTLTQSARALDRAAEKIGEIERKLEKAPAAETSAEAPKTESATETAPAVA